MAWQRFAARYRPMVVAFSAKLGLSESDAQDSAQETMAVFVERYRQGEYDRQKGRLRSWLFGIAYNKARDIQRRVGRELVFADRTDATRQLNAIKADDHAEHVWDAEWQRAVLRECLSEAARHVDPTTLQAFQFYVLEEWPAEKVAAQLGISRNAVYIGKNRVLTRIREHQRRMAEVW